MFQRSRQCLQCHVSWETLGVPGLTVLSTGPADASGYATGGVSDHRTPFAERWGGWYVTGQPGPMSHMGNLPVDLPASKRPAHPPVLPSLEGQFDLHGYLTPYSDIVALMVLEHQARMMNLITDIGWEARVADFDRARLAPEAPGGDGVPETIAKLARTFVDYLLFVDEAPLPGRVAGSSGFAERFSAEGPRDSRGRSLRQLDLEHRLMRYPCSYLIYSPAFDALPPTAKRAVYARMWAVLSGAEQGAKYGRLTPADRRAIVEILRDTKSDLPRVLPSLTRHQHQNATHTDGPGGTCCCSRFTSRVTVPSDADQRIAPVARWRTTSCQDGTAASEMITSAFAGASTSVKWSHLTSALRSSRAALWAAGPGVSTRNAVLACARGDATAGRASA